jgi:hypothetical protein
MLSVFSQGRFDECLIAHYPFDSNAMDVSGNGNHGVVLGATLTADRFGRENRAYYFDGEDDYIAVNPVSDVSNIEDFTISVWAFCYNWDAQPGINSGILDHPYIFDGHSHSPDVTHDFIRDGFHVDLKLRTAYDNYVVNSLIDVETGSSLRELYFQNPLVNKWLNIIFIRKGDSSYHYVNSEFIGSYQVNSSSMNMQHTWFIGTFSGNNPFYSEFNYSFFGVVDDISIYSCAIDQKAIDSIYNQNTLSVDELPRQKSWSAIYPNPVEDRIMIDSQGIDIEVIEIFSPTGNLLGEYKDPDRILNVSYLETGLYLLRITYVGRIPPECFRILKL